MEVILPNGELVRTGQFAVTKGATKHLSKSSFGPSVDGLFLQSGFGIVTKIGMWMTPQPQTFMSCVMEVDDLEGLADMVDILSELKRHDILQNAPIVRNIVAWSSSTGPRHTYYTGSGAMPREVLRDIQRKLNIGYWMCKFAFYGPRQLVEERFAATRSLVNQRAPKARLTGDIHVGKDGHDVDAAEIPAAQGGGGMCGVPDLWTLPVIDYRSAGVPGGVGGHSDFSPTLPANGADVVDWYKCAQAIIEAEGFDSYAGGLLLDKTFIVIHMFIFNKADLSHRHRVERIIENLFVEAKKRGITKYRSHLNHMGMYSRSRWMGIFEANTDLDMVADMYDFNNHAYGRFVESLKVIDHLQPAIPLLTFV